MRNNNLFANLSNEELRILYSQYEEWCESGYIQNNELGKYRDKYIDQYSTSGLHIMELHLLRAIAGKWVKNK